MSSSQGTDVHTRGHCNSMTESAQLADSVKIHLECMLLAYLGTYDTKRTILSKDWPVLKRNKEISEMFVASKGYGQKCTGCLLPEATGAGEDISSTESQP